MGRIVYSLAGILACALVGCNTQRSTEEGATARLNHAQAKPIVAVVPVIDSTQTELAWNLSDEFSAEIYDRLAQSDDFFLANPGKIRAAVKKLRNVHNPFSGDISWVKKAFAQNEFVVFLELVEHEEVPREELIEKPDPHHSSADLKMSMRVRVIDLRGNEPCVVFQELLQDSHFIPRPFTQKNLSRISWGEKSFPISPMGLAHVQFTKEIVSLLEEHILSSSDK